MLIICCIGAESMFKIVEEFQCKEGQGPSLPMNDKDNDDNYEKPKCPEGSDPTLTVFTLTTKGCHGKKKSTNLRPRTTISCDGKNCWQGAPTFNRWAHNYQASIKWRYSLMYFIAKGGIVKLELWVLISIQEVCASRVRPGIYYYWLNISRWRKNPCIINAWFKKVWLQHLSALQWGRKVYDVLDKFSVILKKKRNEVLLFKAYSVWCQEDSSSEKLFQFSINHRLPVFAFSTSSGHEFCEPFRAIRTGSDWRSICS